MSLGGARSTSSRGPARTELPVSRLGRVGHGHSQINGELIQHAHLGTLIAQRADDGYVNATAMCKAHGKKFNHYSENAATKDFVDSLNRSTRISVDHLMQILSNVPNEQRGT